MPCPKKHTRSFKDLSSELITLLDWLLQRGQIGSASNSDV
jgi:hypothetical protein